MFQSSYSLLTCLILSIVGVCTAAPSATAATSTYLDEQRLCAELTASGLGGGVCGTPTASVEGELRWRRQYQEQRQSNGSYGGVAAPRRDACPVLCGNGLGWPLCECKQLKTDDDEMPKANFIQVCSFFCSSYSLHVSGCPLCNIPLVSTYAHTNAKLPATEEAEEIDWEAWCKEMCSSGDGGIACNCDILPMSSPLT